MATSLAPSPIARVIGEGLTPFFTSLPHTNKEREREREGERASSSVSLLL